MPRLKPGTESNSRAHDWKALPEGRYYLESYLAGKLRRAWAAQVESAGTKPSQVRPEVIAVMKEVGIDISGHRSKSVDKFAGRKFEYVLTVCDNAEESCPIFPGLPMRLHRNFEDPAAVQGSETERLDLFRRVRDEIRDYLRHFPPELSRSSTCADGRASARPGVLLGAGDSASRMRQLAIGPFPGQRFLIRRSSTASRPRSARFRSISFRWFTVIRSTAEQSCLA